MGNRKTIPLIYFFTLTVGCLILFSCQAITPTTDPGQNANDSTGPTGSQTKDTNPGLGIPFTLGVGDSTMVAETSLTVTFDEVIEDIRCPTKVNCALDGPVVVQISAELANGSSGKFEMNPNEQKAALAGIPSNNISFGGYEIDLTKVEPHPAQPEDIMNMLYMVTIIVREADPNQDEPVSAVFNLPFTLEVGETASIEDSELKITFEMVERDGRCPSAVQCAEDGPVVVVISATKVGDEQLTTFNMNPDPQLAALSGIPPNSVDYQNYNIELTAVEPYPQQPEDIMNLPYNATIIVR